MIGPKDKALLRELAKKQMEIAALDVNRERERRIRDMHALKPVRPPVWIDEIPWHEMDIEGRLKLRCESEEGRLMEERFRRTLYRWEFIQADMVVEDTFYIPKQYRESGIGITIKEDTISTDADNPIVSHSFKDILDTEEKVDALLLPEVQADPEADRRNLEIAAEVLEGVMPAALRGHQIYYAPWDVIARYRGIENCLIDMLDRPEFTHRVIKKFTGIYQARFTRMEALGLLDFNLPSLHCTPPFSDEMPAGDYDGGKVRLKDVWFRGMAQLFSSASPAMQDEFDLQYMKPFMEKCALSYYGCCEPLDKFIPWLKKIPNMRKIGVSPWADVRSSAEQTAGGYVLARKPNPANAAQFNPDTVRAEIRETIEACRANNCPYEFVLKDISTVRYRPQNLIDWTRTVMDEIDRHY